MWLPVGPDGLRSGLKRRTKKADEVVARLLTRLRIRADVNYTTMPPIGARVVELVWWRETVEDMGRAREDTKRDVRCVPRRKSADHIPAGISAPVVVVRAADHDPDRRIDEIAEIRPRHMVVQPADR